MNPYREAFHANMKQAIACIRSARISRNNGGPASEIRWYVNMALQYRRTALHNLAY